MPRREEPVFNKNKEQSPGSANRHSSESSRKSSSGGSRKSPSRRDAEESGQVRGGSPGSSKRDHPKTSIRAARNPNTASECARILNVPLPTSQSLVDPRTATSTTYLDYRLNQQLRRRKKQIVDTLMAAILECLDKKLEALEEAHDGGERSQPSSCASSGGFRKGNQKPQTAGQKRQLHREDPDDNDDQNGEGGREDRNSKRAKIVSDENRLKYACPYYKFDPERFKQHRTCCGPGWTEVHRVKEHLKRAHSLPKHQCNRCCQLFKEQEELKAHQREPKPCAVKDPSSIRRDLADGFDKDQEHRLQKRVRGSSEEKWKEWYCILFNKDPRSTDIPSPYHDIPDGTRRRSDASNDSHFHNYCEYYRDKLTPLIHRHVEQEVERAILDVEDRVKSNVRARIKGLPAMLHRLIQSIPPPGGEVEGDFLDMTAPDGFDPDNLFDDLDFDETDGFDFEGMGPVGAPVFPEEVVDSSGSSSFSDSYGPAPSSNTSIDDEKPVLLPGYDGQLLGAGADLGYPLNGYASAVDWRI